MPLRLVVPVFAALALTLPAFAGSVDAVHAANAAELWVARTHAPSRAPTGEVRTFSLGDTNIFHLVGLLGGGFVAVGADGSSASIIGFAANGTLPDSDDGSSVWELVADSSMPRTETSRRKAGSWSDRPRFSVASATVAMPRKRSASTQYVQDASLIDLRVAPLLESRWNQKEAQGSPCYNYYTPNNYPCGCVATAIAQVMRFHQWPRENVASVTRQCMVNGAEVSLTTQDGLFDWSSMPLVPESENQLTDGQRQAIGKICSDVGITMGMEYTATVSSAWAEFAHGPFTEVFGYASACSMFYIDYDDLDSTRPLTSDELEGSLLANLDAGMPCPIGVHGHAVVGDGYGYIDGELYCHMECGWGGEHDFWFLVPENSHVHNGAGFSVYSVTYNVFTEAERSLVTGRVLDLEGNAVTNATVFAVTDVGETTAFATNVMTSATGVYAIMVPAHECSVAVWAEADGAVSATNEVVVAKSESVEILDYSEFSCSGYNVCGNRWGNDLAVSGFLSGREVEISGGETVTLTGAQAVWLNSLGDCDGVVSALSSVTPDEFDAAFMLNLDIAAGGWRGWSFKCSGVSARQEGDATVVVVVVRLDRGGRVAPINGRLRLNSIDMATGASEAVVDADIDDALFASGDTATFEFRTSRQSILLQSEIE